MLMQKYNDSLLIEENFALKDQNNKIRQ